MSVVASANTGEYTWNNPHKRSAEDVPGILAGVGADQAFASLSNRVQ